MLPQPSPWVILIFCFIGYANCKVSKGKLANDSASKGPAAKPDNPSLLHGTM